MLVKNTTGGAAWLEEMNENHRFAKPKTDQQASAVADEIINFFNDSLRPTESPRKLIHVERHTTEIENL
jgi:hypothetical protein